MEKIEVEKILEMKTEEYEKLSFGQKIAFNLAIPFGSLPYQPERLSEKTVIDGSDSLNS